VLDFALPTKLLDMCALRNEREFTHMRYSAATCDPNDFKVSKFDLRQLPYGPPRRTDLFIVMTMYNEDEELFCRSDCTAQNSDDEMMEDGDSEEEGEGESGNQFSDDGDEQEEEEEATEVAPFPAEKLIDDEIADEMDEFRNTGLDQILWDDEEDEDEDQPGGYEETLGAEDVCQMKATRRRSVLQICRQLRTRSG
jgi:hypothetical protein